MRIARFFLMLLGSIILINAIIFGLLRRHESEASYIATLVYDHRTIHLNLMLPAGRGQKRQHLCVDCVLIAPTWSHDGRRLFFQGYQDYGGSLDGNFDVYEFSTNEGLQLFRNSDIQEIVYVISPDEEWAAIVTNNVDAHLYIAKSDGTDEKLILRNAGTSLVSWSPDSQWIVFIATLDDGMYRVSVDGTRIEFITRLDNRFLLNPAWSPDGEWIAFQVGDDTDGDGDVDMNTYDIYRVRPDGTDLQQLTNSADYEGFPSWSGGSKWIAYSELSGKIHRMDADGSNKITLTDQSDNALFSAWSPLIDLPFNAIAQIVLGCTIILLADFIKSIINDLTKA